MAIIPTYERRREIAGPGRPTQLSQAAAAAPAEALSRAAGQIGGQVASIAQHELRQNDQKLEDANAMTAANALSKGDEYWNQRQTEIQNSWKVGDPDPREALNKEFSTWAGEQRSTLQTDKARNWFDTNAERMRSRMGQSVYNWQQKTTLDVAGQQFKEGQDADYRLLAQDPTRHAEITARRLEALNAQKNIPEAARIAIGRAYLDGAAETIEQSTMRRDPAGYLKGRTVQPGATTPAAGVPPGAAVGKTQDPVATDLPAEARGLLNVIAGPESAGKYNIRYTPSGGAEFALDGKHPGIMEPTKEGKQSSAAGRYQFTKTTWDQITGGNVPFTPENQDKFAWKLAQQDYQARTGRDLSADLKANGVTPQIRAALSDTWHGLKVQGDGKAEKIYRETLARQGGAAPLTSSDSAGTHLNPDAPETFGMLPYQKQQQLVDEANRLLRQESAQLRSQADRLVADASAMHRDGKPDPFNLGPEYFDKAYGEDGPRVYESYAAGRTMANDIAAFATQTPDQIQATLEVSKPALGEGYAAADARQNARLAAASQVVKLRAEDPMQFAMRNGMTQAQPLDMAKPQEIAGELNRRVGTATMMRGQYGTALRPLTNVEAAQMSSALRAMPTEGKLQYLESVRTGLLSNPAMFHAVMGQIAPDSPVTAVAGSILVKQDTITMDGGWFGGDKVLQPRQVAGLILEGEAILNPTKADKAQDGRGGKFPMPKDTDLETFFSEKAGQAFRGNAEEFSTTYQAFKAYYAGKASRNGVLSTEMDDKLAKEAMTAVTGGVIDYNGNGEVRKPWGMPDAAFNDKVAAAFNREAQANGLTGAAANLSAYGLIGKREGVYILHNGDDVVRGASGGAIVLDINDRARSSSGPLPRKPSALPNAPPNTERRISGLVTDAPPAVDEGTY